MGVRTLGDMTASDSVARDFVRASEREHLEPNFTSIARLQERAQIFRLGHRYPVSGLGQSFVYVLSKGVVGIECATVSGERTVIELLYPGDILVPGLQAPLRDLALIAKRPVEFWRLTITSFAGESARDSQLWQAIFLRLNAQNARSQLHIAATSGLNCEQRIAGFLIEIGSRLGVLNGGVLSFELPMSRYSIAEYLSLNADTVSRTLSALTATKIIDRRGRFQISILNWDALTELCPLSDAIMKLHGLGNAAINY
jgi:CRP/FNR family transcriptional regulator